MTKLVYFAWVRERIGKSEEDVDAAGRRGDGRAICLRWLKARGDGYAHALQHPEVIRVAINQEHVEHGEPIAGAARDRALPADDRRLSDDGRDRAGRPRPGRRFRHRRRDRSADAQASADIGAVVTFTGLCRDEAGTLAALELEHYPGMAEAEIARIAAEAIARWPLAGLHRHPPLRPDRGPATTSCWSSPPRRTASAAFEAADFLMDYLKTRAPFWKKEHRADGVEGDWVSAKESDDRATDRWKK